MRRCPNGDLFKVLASGEASVVTDQIDTFTEKGILLKSGRELEADIIVTATGLNLQMLGGMELSVDGEARELHDQMTYKGVLVENIPNLAWIFGYTNASWTLKSDIAGDYLCRLFKHMDDNGHAVATPRDVEDCALDDRHARPAAIRLRAARQGHSAAPGVQAPVEGAHALRARTPRCCSTSPSTTACCSSTRQPWARPWPEQPARQHISLSLNERSS